MKKSLVFAVMLCAIIFSGLVYGVTVITGQEDAVEISHRVLEGDVAAVEGLSFRMGTQWTGRLFWDTRVTVGENGLVNYDTDFTRDWALKNQSQYLSNWGIGSRNEVVSLWYSNGYHSSTTAEQSFGNFLEVAVVPFKEAAADVAERTPAGERFTEVVTLAEYVEYYPLTLDIRNAGSLNWSDYSENFFADYFGIKIPEEHKMSVTISRRENGAITEVVTEDKGGAVDIECCSVDTEDGVYFAFYADSTDVNVQDIEVKSGNGIFFIPLVKTDEDSDIREVQYKQLSKVFDLPEKNCQALDIKSDEAGNILLLTNESNTLMLRIIDEQTMEEKEKLKLLSFPDGTRLRWMEPAEGNLFVLLQNGDFCFLTQKSGNSYEAVISDSLGEVNGLDDWYRDWAYALDYGDGRLALIWAEEYNDCGAYVYVFGHEGLEYKGYFGHSADYEDYHDYNSILLQESAFTISFAD